MGKPFGLLKRILSISKASKRSEDGNFDRRTSTNELGQELSRTARKKDEEEEYVLAGSVRTTGGIGGLGNGITNAASEIMGPSRAASTGGWKGADHGRGMKKRRLKRASLSASNLLSWGQERVTTPGKRILSENMYSRGHHAPDRIGHPGLQDRNETARMATFPSMNQEWGHAQGTSDKFVDRDAASSQVLADEQFTRVLRSSSSNYKIINKVDYWNLGPIEHPINAIKDEEVRTVSNFPLSESILSPNTTKSLDGALPSLARPPQRSSTLTRAPSTTSTTSASNYKVTVYRRRVHSRISFPDANRALELLHGTSSNSMSSSIEGSPDASPARPSLPSEVDSLRGVLPLERRASAPLPSSLVANETGMRHNELVHTHQRYSKNSVRKQVSSILRVHPVSDFKTGELLPQEVAPSSQKSIMKPFQYPNALDPVNPFPKLDSRDPKAEPGIMRHYTIPLKSSTTNNAARPHGSGLVEKPSSQSFRSSDAKSLSTSSRKERNTLKKRNRRTGTSSTASLSWINGVQGSSHSSVAIDREIQVRPESPRSVFTVSSVQESTIDHRNALAKDKNPLASDVTTVVKGSSLPALIADLFSSGMNTPKSTPVKNYSKNKLYLFGSTAKDDEKLFPDTPRDKLRLAGLRKDPSVVSLLSMYEKDGTITQAAFSNSPVAKEKRLVQPTVIQNNAYTESLDQLVMNTMQNKHSNGLSDLAEVSIHLINQSKPGAMSAPAETSFLSTSVISSHQPELDQNISMMVEWGSLGPGNESQVNSMGLANSSNEGAMNILEKTPVPAKIDGIQGTKTSNRRASEVFAFLNPPGLDDQAEDEPEDSMRENGHESSDISPSPRGRAIIKSSPTQHTFELIPSNEYKLSSGTSPVQIEGDVSNNDSFASQNTTDRSIYRGIYTRLKNMSMSPGVFLSSATGGQTTQQVNGTVYPFTPIDTNKSLPSTPPSSSKSNISIDLYQKLLEADKDDNTFIPLPVVTPLSPFRVAFGITSPRRNIKSKTQIDSPSPYFKKTVKERIAKWENTHPLIIAKRNSTRRVVIKESPPFPTIQSQKDQRLITPTKLGAPIPKVLGTMPSSEPLGLGDGRVFNVSNGRSRLYGPRVMPSPVSARKIPSNTLPKHTTSKPAMKEASPVKDTKPTDLVYGYPLPEELFPDILGPAGLPLVKDNKLQTPQRPSIHDDPSPASSSKLGIYGREIMAIARSKTIHKASGSSERL